jgi:hypothetical protein
MNWLEDRNMSTQILTETRNQRHQRILNQRAEEDGRQALSRLLDRLHERVARSTAFKASVDENAQKKEKLIVENPDEANIRAEKKVEHLAYLAIFPSAGVFDFLFLGAVAEVFMGIGLYGMPPWVLLLGRFLVPTLILVADAYLGTHLVAARDAAFESGRSSGKYFWLSVCIFWALAMAALVAYTCYAKISVEGTPTWKDAWLLSPLAVFTLVFHCAILFGGERLRDAKAYLFFWLQKSHFDRGIKLASSGNTRERGAVSQVYRDYTERLDLHNTRYPNANVGAGPFEKTVVETVNDIFGPVILPPPGQPQNINASTPQPSAQADEHGHMNEPSTTEAGATQHNESANENHHDNGYQPNPFESFHVDVDGKIRDAESEVTA